MTTHAVPAGNIRLKRAYDAASEEDGTRILVERLWARGVSKEHAALDQWMKDIAPSAALRKWFSHDPAKWEEFRRRYAAELRGNEPLVEELRAIARKGTLTLVYSARDEEHNAAVELRDVLLGQGQAASGHRHSAASRGNAS